MKLLRDISVLISAAELGNIVGIDIETVNNWLRHGIISRAPIGGRQLRSRLFSTDEVYKVALTNELVNLGISPSPASDAANAVWKNGTRRKFRREEIFMRWCCRAMISGLLSYAHEKLRGDRFTSSGNQQGANRLLRWICLSRLPR
jgi:hypothetical protein